MYKVLIVEDERRTARSIAQLVNEHSGFHTVGLAGNGTEALEILASTDVDLVLTDIQMPGIDGIALLKILHEKFPDCLTVILSGYSEFEYAKAAIQYGAFNYLLKPIDQDELTQVLREVGRRISEQRRHRLYRQARIALEGGRIMDDQSVQLALLQGECSVFWGQPEQQTVLQCCFGKDCMAFSYIPNIELLLVIPSAREIGPQVHDFFSRCQSSTKTPVQLIYTEQPLPLQNLAAAVRRLHRMLEQQARLFRSGCFPANPGPVPPSSVRSMHSFHLDQAVEAICSQNPENLRQCLGQALRVCTYRADLQNNLFAVIQDPRLTGRLSPEKLDALRLQLTQTISMATEPEACIDQLSRQLMQLQQTPAHCRDMHDLAESVAQYLELHYSRQISLEVLTKQYGVSMRNLNRAFKDCKGVRPAEYLLQLRMDRAKQMLAAKPDAMIKDVANSVGYPDPLYFSKVFQKTTGYWPTEYQHTVQKQK